jgi:hypothetical protein
MDKEGALAAVSILVLSGVLVYAYRHAAASKADSQQESILSSEAQQSLGVIQSEILLTGSANAYNSGAAMYVANTPYLFQAPLGNTMPTFAVNNIPFATTADTAGNLQSL